jgi:hypothetical protein
VAVDVRQAEIDASEGSDGSGDDAGETEEGSDGSEDPGGDAGRAGAGGAGGGGGGVVGGEGDGGGGASGPPGVGGDGGVGGPPAPADAAPEMREPAGPPAGDWVRIPVEGGYLRWSASRGQVDAHCTTPGHGGPNRCKLDCKARGQMPVARQALWLWVGPMPEMCSGKHDHGVLKGDVGKPVWKDLRADMRQNCVEQAAHDPSMAALLLWEGAGGVEPDHVPYRNA